MPKLVEAENEAIPVEVENGTWYNPLKGYGLRHSPFPYKGDVIMARKSRKHPELAVPVSKDTVGYIRLSVLNREPHGSVENQRLVIEEWEHQRQIPIMRYYIDNGFSGKHFDRPAFQEIFQDIERGKIDCVVVKDFSRLGRDYITVGYYLEMFFPSNNPICINQRSIWYH